MIQIKDKINSPVPGILATKGKDKKDKLIDEYNNGKREFTFDTRLYGSTAVKDELIRLQHGKCCFCESDITHISHGDIEHYRPKAGWVQGTETLNKPGYYWLAYDWDNLLLACEICNRSYKKNYFPLQDNTKRALSHNDNIENEDPLFLHPVNDDPEEHIGFNEEVPVSINGSSQGNTTIDKVGLDRPILNERRREKLSIIKQLHGLAAGHPETNKKQEAKQMLLKVQEPGSEYSSMLRCFFRRNPIDF